MNAMSSIIHRFFPEVQEDVADVSNITSGQQQDNKKVIAAITAAIAHHRKG
ncbi:hypothetical protein MNB_SM-3-966 [hydrothermal vent metagenome]|uniref:Uncharacterized protein n=1 Tax=hydrothermal vent metagenome TaxID=652676 RepID=A0A1W1D3T2_9ZZZZ